MDKQQARDLIKKTFEQPFDKPRFTVFVKNLLNKIDESKAFHARGDVKESFRTVVKTYERIGSYASPNGEKIDIIIVYLQKTFSIHHARVTQRNFAGKYLTDRGQKDAGLFAFVSPDNDDWRFSLVRMDYKFEETPTGKMKVKEEFTPARRWSFLVGANEKSHTAQSRLVKILAEVDRNPTLAELEEAFNIETVTKEFFLKYRDLFIRTKEALDVEVKRNSRIKADFKDKGVNTVDFAKKLLGQIVFLYFLQKKGWFGVDRDAKWGTGSRQFLRELFNKKHGDFKNFFNDILEHLFYDALRNDRSHDDHYYGRFNCKIPFLNGGLFDPIGFYDWVHNDILLPDSLFSNDNKTKEGDSGDGILDIFDRYNFTVKEDEPLDKEVAIDPELLGKAYEKFNAIRPDNYGEYKKALKSGKKGDESKFNKQFGVYYTPREIVHYMCQQSLINYLYTELNSGIVIYEKLGEKQFNMFGNKGKKGQLDLTIEHMSNPVISKDDIENFIHSGEQVRENEARVERKGKETSTYSYKLSESIRTNAGLIDNKLEDITVCDPAVGSGAFPVGMMSEIVKARNVLSTFIQDEKRTPYNFKRRCIEHSLYGVDIDPGAVEIAKLRLWLSLVVDEGDIKNIKPLPNLDYKIVCGNSLLGIEKDIFHYSMLDKLEKLKAGFFSETNPTKKQLIRNEIDTAILGLYQNAEKFLGYKVDFDFKVNFSEVFHETLINPNLKSGKGGFNVVIGNPPYVQLQKDSGKLANIYKECGYKTFERTGDIYTLFYENGINHLKQNGFLCFITSNKWMRAGYGKSLRYYFITKNPHLIIDLGPSIFENATVDTNILIIQNAANNNSLKGLSLSAEAKDKDLAKYVSKNAVSLSKMTKDAWFIGNAAEQCLKEKIERIGKPLKEWDVKIYFGIKTGLNEAFIIDQTTRDSLIAEDPKSEEVLKPILRGRDIKRYGYEWAGLWLIASGYDIDVPKLYPAVFNHLKQYGKKAKKRDDQGLYWWNLRPCAYYPEFAKEKVVWKRIGSVLRFGYDTNVMYCQDSTCIMTGKRLKYLCAFMNSKLGYQQLFDKAPKTGTGDVIVSVQALEPLLVPPITPSNCDKIEQIEELVEKILKMKKIDADTAALERDIDQLVYDLYELTEDEIAIVEGR